MFFHATHYLPNTLVDLSLFRIKIFGSLLVHDEFM